MLNDNLSSTRNRKSCYNSNMSEVCKPIGSSSSAGRAPFFMPEKGVKKLSTAIMKLLRERGIGRKELWLAVGGNRSRIYEVSKGARQATRPLREKIALFFGEEIDHLFDESGMAKKQ